MLTKRLQINLKKKPPVAMPTADIDMSAIIVSFIMPQVRELIGQEFNELKKEIVEASKELFVAEAVKIQKKFLKGDQGDTYVLTQQDKDEIASGITVPVVEKVIEKTEVIIKEQPITIEKITNEIKEVVKDEPAIQLAIKLNTLNEEVDQSVIKGLKDWMDKVQKRIEKGGSSQSGGGGGDVIAFYDLSSQTNGVLKSFTVPKGRKVVVFGSDFPSVLMEGNGFTMDTSRTILTLTVDNPPSRGSQLLYQYTK